MHQPEMTCVIAEDETLLRDALVALLAEEWPCLRIVAACDDGGTALEAIATHKPDVAFLDIRMPGLTGLEVAAGVLDASPATQVVFVTAYDQYAVDAFDAGAVDYLLKPVQADRLARAVARLREKLSARPADLGDILQHLKAALPDAPREKMKWIRASVGKQIRLIDVADVLFFQSDAKYTRVVTAAYEALVRIPLKDLVSGLDPAVFWQIHRGTMVNVHAIAAAERIDAERLQVLLRGHPEKLPVSRSFTYLFRD